MEGKSQLHAWCSSRKIFTIATGLFTVLLLSYLWHLLCQQIWVIWSKMKMPSDHSLGVLGVGTISTLCYNSAGRKKNDRDYSWFLQPCRCWSSMYISYLSSFWTMDNSRRQVHLHLKILQQIQPRCATGHTLSLSVVDTVSPSLSVSGHCGPLLTNGIWQG